MVQWRSWLIKIHISGVINLDIGHVIEKKKNNSQHQNIWTRFGLRCLTPLSTICQLHVYRGVQFYWWRKLEYPEKPPTCRKSLINFIT